jgi:hypothetical protein
VILLKNTGGLPLVPSKIKNLAVIGSDAGQAAEGPNTPADKNADDGTLAM